MNTARDISFADEARAFAEGRFLRVVNYHNTPAADGEQLEAELAAYAERYAPVGLDDLDRFRTTGLWHKDRPGLIPVFYEGYRNNAEVAAPLAEKAGLTAWFFIATGFLDVPVAEQYDFAEAHEIDLVPEDVRGERLAMTWDQVAALGERHVVTPHTACHEETANIVTPEDFEREIFAPKRRMDAVTGQSAACFAFLRGTSRGHSADHDAALRDAGYRYLFSNTMVQHLG
ncbi:hypothetical protein KNE206_73130 [Kitasatospora sp. NE20-6]|uniref:polysaccharide deacetylase family protein n=1 Tax=Kitasatospora sp. NE20-6 TaxID=2859066 RepID=UPI0034DC198B